MYYVDPDKAPPDPTRPPALSSSPPCQYQVSCPPSQTRLRVLLIIIPPYRNIFLLPSPVHLVLLRAPHQLQQTVVPPIRATPSSRSNTSSASFSRTTRESEYHNWRWSKSNRRSCNLSTTSPLQKIVTAEKGVALDFQGVSSDIQSQSKELYLWGQREQADVKDGWYSNDNLYFFDLTALPQPLIGWVF